MTLEASIDKEIEWIVKEIERIQVMPGGDSDIYEPGAFMKLATKMVVRLEHVTDVLTEGESKAAEDARDRKQREEDGRAQFGPLSIAVTKLKAEYKASSAQRHEAAKMTDSAARDQIYRAIDARITALRTEVKRLLADAEAAGAAIFERQRAETRAQIAKDQQTTAAQNALLEAGRTGRR